MRELDDAKRTAALSVLGLPVGASWAQITQRYHRLLFQVHPDHRAPVPVDQETTGQMMKITAAYRTLREDHQHQDRQIHNHGRNDGTTRPLKRMSIDWLPMARIDPPIMAGPVRIIAPYSGRRRER